MNKGKKFTDYEKKTVYARYDGCCVICGSPVRFRDLTIDHIIPLSQGGTNNMDNLQLACKACNLMKNCLTMEQLFRKLWELFMYNWKVIIKIRLRELFLKKRNSIKGY